MFFYRFNCSDKSGIFPVNKAQLDTGDTLIFAVDWSADSYVLTLFGATGSVYLWGIPAA